MDGARGADHVCMDSPGEPFRAFIKRRIRQQPGGARLYFAWALCLFASAGVHFGAAVGVGLAAGFCIALPVVLYPFWRWEQRRTSRGHSDV